MLRKLTTAAAVAALAATTATTSAAPENTTTTTITYQGRLDNAGAPFSGVVPMGFAFYSEPLGGNVVSDPVALGAVEVTDGLFTVELPFDAELAGPRPFWIETTVNGSLLNPRQRYGPAVSAVQAGGAELVGDAIWLSRDKIGINTARNDEPATATIALPSAWQSFQPTISGPLGSVLLDAKTVLGNSVRMSLFEGEGEGGPVLLDNVPALDFGNQFFYQTENGPQLNVGQTYTFRFSVIDSGTQLPGGANFDLTQAEGYKLGRASTAPDDDLLFAIGVDADESPTSLITGNGTLALAGQLRVVGSDTELADDVDLPAGSIEADELLDEPGVASNYSTTQVEGDSVIPIPFVSSTIETPGPGFVVAMLAAEVRIEYQANFPAEMQFRIQPAGSQDQLTEQYRLAWTINDTGSYTVPVSLHSVFDVPAAGSYDYEGAIRESLPTGSTFSVIDSRLTLMYFPTAYGDVAPSQVPSP